MVSDADVGGQITELIALGASLLNSGQVDAAAELFKGLHTIDPANVEVAKQLGIALASRGDFPGAIPVLSKAAEGSPRDALVHNVLSVCRFETGDYEEALASADRAVALRRRFVEAHNSRGNALGRLGRHAEALEAFRAALKLTPDDPVLHINISNVLGELGRPEAALKSIERALALDRRIPQAHANRANLLRDLGRHEAALQSYAAALALDPDFVDAHWNRSLCNLVLGNFEAGWRGYEWRWRRGRPETAPRDLPAPLWLGQSSLAGKTILLHCEQGLGDSIQFIRYAPLVAGLGARVVVEAYPPLVKLFGSVDGVAEVVSRGAALPVVDFQCPLMSLPLALGDFSGAPGIAPPYLAPPATKREEWRGRLGPSDGLRVGVVCSGSPTHGADHLRSLPLAQLIAALPVGPQYHLLQKELAPADRQTLEASGRVTFWGDQLADFTDSAALCELMDIVVSVDTSMAHLAGALGRQLRVLVAYDPDWRWGLHTETSDWYPSARVRRQSARRDWSDPLAQIAGELVELGSRA